MITLQEVIDLGENLILTYGPKVLLALLVLIVGLRVIRGVGILMEKGMRKKRVDPSLRHFLEGLVKISLKVMLFISVISMLGVATTSFVAVLGAAGLAIGLALQGSLANFAGGVLILFFKPFKVGDYIEAAGHSGSVEKIEIFNTILLTPDNKTIILPNGSVSNNPITNYSAQDTRRVDFSFGVGYETDLKKAKDIILTLAKKHKKVLKDPEPFARVGELADSSINITTRLWVKSEDYWDVKFDMIEDVKAAFDKAKISIPFPQMDVHLHK